MERGCRVQQGRKNGELLFNGCNVSSLPEERALETDGGDGYTTIRTYLILML